MDEMRDLLETMRQHDIALVLFLGVFAIIGIGVLLTYTRDM